MTARLTIHAAGPHATVQDLGRPGWLATGIAPSGAFDHHSLRWANHLVGEDPATATSWAAARERRASRA